ncbi:hypothetical protein JEQ25_12690 [Bacillus subtilis]|nr:hypothetical protein JEQ25_12690 [Bacillus subtilis]
MRNHLRQVLRDESVTSAAVVHPSLIPSFDRSLRFALGVRLYPLVIAVRLDDQPVDEFDD